MEGVCEGCERQIFVTEYIYIYPDGRVEKQGMFCPTCMCCSVCGEVLTPDRLAYTDSIYIPRKNGRPSSKLRMTIPARLCSDCAQDLINEEEEEWDVQP
jgi:uncharacterized protein YmfQ (DUF2313 family)